MRAGGPAGTARSQASSCALCPGMGLPSQEQTGVCMWCFLGLIIILEGLLFYLNVCLREEALDLAGGDKIITALFLDLCLFKGRKKGHFFP